MSATGEDNKMKTMIGEGNYSSNPTVYVPSWAVFDDPTADTSLLFAAGGLSVSPNAEDFSWFDALTALHPHQPLNGVDLDSDESGRESDLPLKAYSCDDFRMFEFKVRKCRRGRSHDWTESPFAHPGEKARRRDPRKLKGEEDALPLANWLILLSLVGETSESACGSRNFRCKTCGRKFATFQALRGHQASHKKPRLLSQNSDQPLSTSAGLLMGHGDRWCGLCDNYMELTANGNIYSCRRCHRCWNLNSSAKSLNNQEYCSIDINDGEPNAKVLLPHKVSKVHDSCWATSPEMVLGVTSSAAMSLMSYASTGSHSNPLLYVVAGFTGVGFCSALASRSLRRRNPKAASWFGKVGAVASASGFISALGMSLPQNTVWTCVVAGVSCLIPTIAMALA